MIRMDVIGHIGQDAIVRNVTGQPMKAISFSVAHAEKYRDSAGVQHEKTIWVTCTIWRNHDKLAIVPYLTKGTRVYVVGQPSAEGYLPKQGGNVKADLRLRVDNIELLGASNNNQQPNTFGKQEAAAPASNPRSEKNTEDVIGEDDLPF